jgi:hypothetical protein
MGRYSVSHQTAAGADTGLINFESNTTAPPRIYDLIIGSDATPADVAAEYMLNRTTTVGVGGSALTEVPLDPLTVAAGTICHGGTWTTDPVDTANTALLMIPLNQRATFRWVAAPGGELIAKALAENGLFLRTVSISSGTPNINVTIHWWE